MTLRERWHKTTISNKINVVLTTLICLATIVNVVNSIVQSLSQSRQADALTKAVADVKTALANGATVTKGAVEAAITAGNNATRTTLAENRDAFTKALSQNDKAVAASVRQSKTALDASIAASRMDQRAWMGPVDVLPPEHTVDGRRVYVREGSRSSLGVVIVNSGRTPAIFVSRIRAAGMVSGVAFRAAYGRITDTGSLMMASPNARLNIDSQIPDTGVFTREEVDRLTSGQWILYLYGFIGYRDIFDATHYTTFCFFLNRTLATFGGCSVYNNGD